MRKVRARVRMADHPLRRPHPIATDLDATGPAVTGPAATVQDRRAPTATGRIVGVPIPPVPIARARNALDRIVLGRTASVRTTAQTSSGPIPAAPTTAALPEIARRAGTVLLTPVDAEAA